MKKDVLLDKAGEMFMRFGIKSVSMDDISRALGVSKKTLYQIIPQKRQLIHDSIAKLIEGEQTFCNYNQENTKDAIEELLGIVNHVVNMLGKLSASTMYDLSKYYKNVFQLISEKRDSMIKEFLGENMRRGIAEGLYRKDLEIEHISNIYISVVGFILEQDTIKNKTGPDVDLYKSFVDYHLRAIVNDKGLELYHHYLKNNTQI